LIGTDSGGGAHVGQLGQQRGARRRVSPMPTMPPQQTLDAGGAHLAERIEAILLGVRADHLAVELGRGIEVVVVIVEAGGLELLRLAFLEHAQRDAGFHAQRLDRADHGRDAVEVLVLRAAPGGAHAEARGALVLGRLGRANDFLDIQQRLALGLAVMRRLRAVAAVLRTATGLDRQQGRQLDGIGGMILPMHFLGAEQQIVEWQFEQADDGVGGPAQLPERGSAEWICGAAEMVIAGLARMRERRESWWKEGACQIQRGVRRGASRRASGAQCYCHTNAFCAGRQCGSCLCPACRDSLPRLPAERCPVCALPTPGRSLRRLPEAAAALRRHARRSSVTSSRSTA
jgi:hypothetical protein